MMKLSANALQVLEARYLLRNARGEITEDPEQLFRRIAGAVAQAEIKLSSKQKVQEQEEQYFQVLSDLEFLPNTPTLMNAGTRLGQLAACFVLPVEDSLKSIFAAVKQMALINQSGGGTGFDFSRLRPKGDYVKTSKGIASGPLSFIRVFDTTTQVIKQGGRRRGANMGVLRVSHPDILEFIQAKQNTEELTSFNLSVSIDDVFMQAVEQGGDYALINPRSGSEVKKVPAREIFGQMAKSAWDCGDPGVLFIDQINRENPLIQIGPIHSTNPCGEQPLFPNESCVLGSINLKKMLKGKRIDWDKLRRIVWIAVRFLDNVIEINRYPLGKIERVSKSNRKIGLGIMGLADVLIVLGLAYDSQAAVNKAEEIMKTVSETACRASRELAKERGPFPNFSKSVYAQKGEPPLRNATLTTIAPTGSISIIAGCSSGIEPLFGLAFSRNVLDGKMLEEVNPLLTQKLAECGLANEDVLEQIKSRGSLKGVWGVPEDIRRLFVTAFEIDPRWHIKIQAAMQKHTHNSVSKTINFPNSAGTEDIQEAYLLAHELKCKGLTVYRDGSKKEQVLYLGCSRDECL